MSNGANIFNGFELVIETLQKTAPKKQDYLKSSLFHVLISCKDRKWCSCATSNKLFFLIKIKNEEVFLSEVCEAAVYSAFWGWERFPGINQSRSHAMWYFHCVLDYLRAQQVIKSIFPAQQKLFPLSQKKRLHFSWSLCCSWKNWRLSIFPQGLCVLCPSVT